MVPDSVKAAPIERRGRSNGRSARNRHFGADGDLDGEEWNMVIGFGFGVNRLKRTDNVVNTPTISIVTTLSSSTFVLLNYDSIFTG
jgi:hypothetical protein